jgi:CheY-like chemotaxis protein
MVYSNTILLAEDDDDDAMFFESAVREVDPTSQVVRFVDGLDLINNIASTKRPSILFLDINMPRMNGYECLRRLRNNSVYQELPIVIFSTAGPTDLIRKLYEAGANHFIVKPNEFNQWKSIIENALNSDWSTFSKNNMNRILS